MNQSKFSLADVLTLVGTLIFGTICFLSFNFLTMGDITPSILKAVAIALMIGGFAFLAKILKKTNGNFLVAFIFEIIFVVLFIVTSIIFLKHFAHFFTVNSQKNEIQQKMIENVSQAENMFDKYEIYSDSRKVMYRQIIDAVVLAKLLNEAEYKDYGFAEGTTEARHISNIFISYDASLYPSNYLKMKEIVNNWLAKSKNTIQSWKPIGTVIVLKEIEKNITDWESQLNTISTYKAHREEADEFNYPLTFDDVTSKFTEIKKPSIFGIIIGIVLYLMMILSYTISLRNTKNPYGLFSFFRKKSNNKANGVDVNF